MVTYQGSWNISFNLYGVEDEHFLFEETKEAILKHMREEHLKPLQERFKEWGIDLKDFVYYSPKYYNYTGDSLDLVLSISDRALYESKVKSDYSEVVKTTLDNKSCDGYISFSANSKEEILEDKETHIDVVSTVLSGYLLNEETDFYSHFVYGDTD